MVTDDSQRFVLLDRLGEEYAERYRRGERPALEEYIDRYPELADEIREYFPAMVDLEQVKQACAAEVQPPDRGPLPSLGRLGDYRIIREIGRGGMGVVYEAEQVSLGRHVALKVLPCQLLVDARTKQRFEREARSAAKLHHTNIVPVFGVGEHEGSPYYAMQFIQGLGLDEVLEELKRLQPEASGCRIAPRLSGGELRVSPREVTAAAARRDVTAADMARSLLTGRFTTAEDGEATVAESAADRADDAPTGTGAGADDPVPSPAAGRLSDSFSLSSSSMVLPGIGSGSRSDKKRDTYWQSVARIGVQVADALQHAHAQGVLHRDIKPSNLLLDTAGVVWVTDFGLAKADDQENLTHTGDILGTLRYIPPEAFDGRTDARADIYSLGLTLYELLGLRPAFEEKERNRLIRQVTTSEPARLDRANPEVPPDLVTIVHKAIERERAHRYPTAGELMSDLQRFLDDEPIQARRHTHWERSRRWARRNPVIAWMGGMLTAVLVLAAVGSMIFAAQMTSLATRATRAADEERKARSEAVQAREREAGERAKAEAAQTAAETSRSQAMDALQKAEESFAKSRAAVNDYLTAVSDDPGLKAPGLSPLRARLLQSALGFYQQFLRERASDPTLRKELASVYYKVGTILADLGQRQPAGQSFAESMRLYEALAAEAPNDPEIQDGLARALSRRREEPRAIAIWEKLVRTDDPRYQADLGYAYNNVGLRAGEGGDRAKELEFLRKALLIRERLVQLRPDDPEARVGLSASLNNIAIRLKVERNAEKLDLLRRAVEQCEAAYRLRPADSLGQQFLAIQLDNLASFARQAGATEEELAARRRRVDVLDRRARDNPTVPGNDTAFVQGFSDLVDALRTAGRPAEALQVAERARERIAEATEESTEFFRKVSYLSLVAHSIALARSKAAPGAAPNADREAAEAVKDLRQHVLAGWRDPRWMRTDPRTEPLRERADFKELLARMDELGPADAAVRKPGATPREKLSARRQILAALEALARPLPPARFIRRNLAQARQDLAQALLDAGRVEEARAAFDEALAERQALLAEAPTDEALRIDLVQSRFSAGDLLAAAGRLREAVAAWGKGLAALEAELRENPNSLPLQTALSTGLTKVGDQYLFLGLWAEGLKCYRRAFQVQTPVEFVHWLRYALLLDEAGDTRAVGDLIRRALARRPNTESIEDEVSYDRLVLLAPSDDPRWTRTLQGFVVNPRRLTWGGWNRWIRAFARIRLGREQEGMDQLKDIEVTFPYWNYWKWSSVALAEDRRGHDDAAREALRRADLESDRHTRQRVTEPASRIAAPNQDAVHFRALLREAHRAISGGPLPDSPYERMFRGRVLLALGETEKAEAEFEAAVALRPDDAELWLTRARIFADLGRKDRAAADRIKAQVLKGDDPRTWVETGRLLAELGEHKQADAAFARASALGKGSLYPFLEAGWWVAGPYPPALELSCPPEFDPDPSKPIAAVNEPRDLKWQSVSFAADTASIGMESAFAGRQDVSLYALTYVYAQQARSAALILSTGEGPVRLWVNGRLAFEGYACWKGGFDSEAHIPIALKAGRNTLLIKTQHVGSFWCHCRFEDDPTQKAMNLLHLGLWSEAADALAEADRRVPLDAMTFRFRVHALFAAGRDDEARRAFAEMVRRFARPDSEDVNVELLLACVLPDERAGQGQRWIVALRRLAERDPGYWPRFLLAYGEYRGGHYADAETHLRQAIQLQDEAYNRPLLASILHRAGKTEEAYRLLQETERQQADRVRQALAETPYQPAGYWEARLWYRVTVREARRLIIGKEAGPVPDETAVMPKLLEVRSALDQAEDDFARLVLKYPNQPRLWVEHGRRLGERGRWDESARAFAKATELAPGDPQVWKARGRARAELGRWDEAAADLSKALDLTPEPKREFPYYPWEAGRGDIDDVIARSDELFGRVFKQRPRDRTLSARRAESLAEDGRLAEAEAALWAHVDRFPDDWWAPTLLAKALLHRGKLGDSKRVCRQALDRYKGQTEYYLPINVGRAALLAPAGFEDHPLIRRILADAEVQQVPEFWMQCTAALAELRRGNAAAAIKRLDARVFAFPDYANSQAMADVVRALACQKAGLPDQALAALGRAQAALEAHRQRPDLGAKAWDWHNWTQVEILAREAEGLIPSAPAPAGRASLAREQAERRERKARADRLSTRAALAWICLDVGQKEEAAAELKEVLAERTKIAAEEPGNADYRADLIETLVQSGRLPAAPRIFEILPTAARRPGVWRYTTRKPADDWTRPEFDDSRWEQGPAGFGTAGTPGAFIGTTWDTPDIWIRRSVDFPPSIRPARLRLHVYHDEDVEIALNGVPVASRSGYRTNYETIEAQLDALGSIPPGKPIVLAAHCHQIGGGQGVDVGLSLIGIDPGRIGEGIPLLQRAAALSERMDPESPRRRRIRRDLTATYLEFAKELRKGDHLDELARALQGAVEIVAKDSATSPNGSVDAWLVRCVSHGWRGEIGRAREDCRKAAVMMKPAAGDMARLGLVRMAVSAAGLDSPEADKLLAAAAGEPPADLTEAIRQNPEKARGHRNRGDWYARRGLWKKAADDLAEAIRLEPDALSALQLGTLLGHLGEIDRYREHCRATFARWAETTNTIDAEQAAKTCLLRADSGVDPERLAGLVQVAVSGDDKRQYFEWSLLCKGLHAYRTGKCEEALASCREADRRAIEPLGAANACSAAARAVEAMVLARQGDSAAARGSLEASRRLIDEGFPIVEVNEGWHTWLSAYDLYREAETVIDGAKATIR